MKNKRIKYLIGFVITFLLEAVIALYFKDNIIRSYVGDILIIICLYFLAKTIFEDRIKNIAIYIFILGVFAEIMQYFNISQYIAGDNKVLRIILGATFDIKDIICYAIGFCIIKGMEFLERK